MTTFREFLKLLPFVENPNDQTAQQKLYSYVISNKYHHLKTQLNTVKILVDSQTFFEQHWKFHVVISTVGTNLNHAHRWCYDNFGPRIDTRNLDQRWQVLCFDILWGRTECAFFFKTESDKIEFALRFAQ